MSAPVDTERLVRELADQIWEEKFAARYAAEVAGEATRRAEAFLDAAMLVAGVRLRPLTPYDVLILDGAESPYIAGAASDATRADLSFILWHLSADNTPGLFTAWRRRLHIARCAQAWEKDKDFVAAHTDFLSWIDSAFADSAAPRRSGDKAGSGIGTYFLAPLLVALASELGALDPATGRPFIHSPLARLWQYLKAIRARQQGSEFTDFNASDRLKSEMLAELNRRLPAALAAAQPPADSVPSPCPLPPAP